MKDTGEFARPQYVQQPETNNVCSVSANNLPTGFYIICLTCLCVVNNVAVAAKERHKSK